MKALIPSIHTSKFAATAACVAFALTCAGPSVAAESEVVRQTVVQFGDLNLANPQGAAALYKRIATAADEVCDAFGFSISDLGSRTRADACVKKAIAGAVTKVGRPELFAVYNARNPAPLGLRVAAQGEGTMP